MGAVARVTSAPVDEGYKSKVSVRHVLEKQGNARSRAHSSWKKVGKAGTWDSLQHFSQHR